MALKAKEVDSRYETLAILPLLPPIERSESVVTTERERIQTLPKSGL